MIPYTINGMTERMSFDEMHSAGRTHSHQQYAYGERPSYPHPWQRTIYHRFLDMSTEELSEILGMSADDVRAFKAAEGLRRYKHPNSPKVFRVTLWTRQEDAMLIERGPLEASTNLDRTYIACKNRLARMRKNGM